MNWEGSQVNLEGSQVNLEGSQVGVFCWGTFLQTKSSTTGGPQN